MSNMRRFVILPLGLALLIVAGVYFVIFKPYRSDPPPVLGQVLDFTFTDSTNQSFGKKNLDGKVWVANFIFTSCSGVCPRMTSKMQSLYRSYDRETGVDFVSISVDPDTDTPQKLAEYAARFEAKPDQWHFLTGPYDEIHKLAVNSFKLGKIDEPIFHSERFVLVDRLSQIRGYYDYDDRESIKKLFHDIALVMKE